MPSRSGSAISRAEQAEVDDQRAGRSLLPGLHPHRLKTDLGFALHGTSDGGPDQPAQARNFAMYVDEHNLPLKMVMRDNDKKYPKAFDDVFTTPTCKVKRNVPASPNLQAHVERVIQTLKHEALNGFCVVSERHLDHILRRAADWYNHRRGHSARGNLPPERDSDGPPMVDLKKQRIVCDSEFGGHLKSYRAAA